MRFSKITAFLLVSALSLVGSGCAGIFSTQPPTPLPDVIYTQAAETVIFALTQNAPPETPTQASLAPTETLAATITPLPTNTPLPTATPLPSLTPTQPATATPEAGTLIYSEDFSGDSGWVEENNDSWRVGQMDGGYSILVKISYAPIWSVRNQELTDVRLEVDAARLDGPADGYYGLVCRHLNGDNYYALVIGSDGFYGIAIKEGGDKLRYLVEGRDQQSVILSGSAYNRIRGDCIGSTLSLYANGQKLLETQDSTFDSGDIGLLAGTLKVSGLRVLFDNYAAYTP
jgi:hypothetical protein